MKIHSRPFLLSLVALSSLALVAQACSSAPGGTASPGDQDAASPDTGSPAIGPVPDAAIADSGGGGAQADAARSDAAIDAAVSLDANQSAPEAAAAPTCGAPPARYTLLTGADAGLVRDNVTELVWMTDSVGGGEPPQTQTLAATYCTGRGMRLPTKDEATALAASYASCAFGQWSTWTSTTITGGDAWVVDYLGEVSPQVADNFPSAVLCVRDPSAG
jgi:hypothetical protein